MGDLSPFNPSRQNYVMMILKIIFLNNHNTPPPPTIIMYNPPLSRFFKIYLLPILFGNSKTSGKVRKVLSFLAILNDNANLGQDLRKGGFKAFIIETVKRFLGSFLFLDLSLVIILALL